MRNSEEYKKYFESDENLLKWYMSINDSITYKLMKETEDENRKEFIEKMRCKIIR